MIQDSTWALQRKTPRERPVGRTTFQGFTGPTGLAALAVSAALAAGAALPLAAWAHGEKPHAAKAGPVKKEQKDWGIAGERRAARRTIEITMSDTMRFTPDRITVREGETIRFVHRNAGKVLHEFVLGNRKELDEHAALMKKFPTMEHDEPYMAHVPPGQTAEIVWTFNRAGEFDFACLIPGHYDAGMVGKVLVTPARAPAPARPR